VREQLAHLAGADAGVVRDPLTPGPAVGYRNRLDLQVMHGRPAYFRHRSRRLEPIERCLLAAPPIADMIARLGDLGALSQITLRAGCTTEESLVIVRGPLPEAAANWDWPIARVRRGRAIAISGPSHLHERVDGVTFRITGSAFFQNNTEGAEALVTVVEEAAAVQPEDVFLDAYAGGGLFTLTVGRNAGRVLAVESAAMALSDLRYNARAAGVEVSVAAGDVVSVLGASRERWTVAVCDPPRSGLGAAGVAALVRPHPRAIVYVSCDPAVLSRDARLFADSGYELQEATPVDMFPQTYHIETVARFAPDGRNPRTGNGTL
jgi:23S rRNA (uracil1939-C5)-methyltransferase